MVQNWKSWCRLCASENGEHVNLFGKAENQYDLVEIVEKHLMLTVTADDEAPTSVCLDCVNFMLKISQFAIRSAKAHNMYKELLLNKDDYELLDEQSIRKMFEIEGIDEFVQIEVMGSVDSELSANQKTNVSNCDDTDKDPFINKNDALVQKRKRGRPRKNDIAGPLLYNETALEEENCEDSCDDDPYDDDDSESVKPMKKRKRRSIASTCNGHTCKICDIVYETKKEMEKHMNDDHDEDTRFDCSTCSKSFKTKKRLKVHESIHLPNAEKMVHPCPYCDKKFTKSVNVQAHIKAIHIGDRPFICEECGKSFNTKGALKGHQITHSDDCPYQCSFCPKKFKNLPRLRTHEDIHNNTVYVCPNCGIKLNTKRTLKMHMVVHSDQKKYKCNFCSNEYKRSKALKNHLILHSGLRPYLCPFCDKTFANGSNCRSHKKKAHPEELAAMEAAGEVPATANIPKLEYLQPKMKDDEHELDILNASVSYDATEAIAVTSIETVEDHEGGRISLTIVKDETTALM